MNITIDLPVKDEKQKKELEKYLVEKAQEFLLKESNGENVLELVEVDYDDVSENVKKTFNEVEKEYKKNWLKNFTFVSID
jgi:hypothetical protein